MAAESDICNNAVITLRPQSVDMHVTDVGYMLAPISANQFERTNEKYYVPANLVVCLCVYI